MSVAGARELVGRDGEIERLEAFLDRLPDGAAAVVLEGEAGIGKTELWRYAVAAAAERGQRVLEARPAEIERNLSFTVLADLLGGHHEQIAELPVPQRRSLSVALLLEDPTGAPPDTRAIAVATLELLRGVARARPVLLAIDDLHWCDPSTRDVLAFVTRRLANERIGVLATQRPGSAGAGTPLDLEAAPAGRLERIEVGPLSLGAVHRALRERLPTPLRRPLLRKVYERSGGNPFYALELARAAAERDDERLPESLRALVSGRIDRLADETRTLLVLLAAASQPTVGLVRDLDGEEALDAAERRGVVVLEGTRVRFSHPLLAAAAYEGATSRERRTAHRRLAALVHDPERRARHLALAAEGPAEDIAVALDAAAAAALSRGAAAAAAELAEQALALTPPQAAESIQRRRLEVARRCRTLGDTHRQRALLEQVLADAASDRERAESLSQLAALAGDEGDGARARELIRQALDAATGDDRLGASINLGAVWLEGGVGGAVERAQASLVHAERTGDAALEAEALSAVGYASFTHGLGFRRDLFERAVELERMAGFIEAARRPTTRYGLTAKWAGDIPLSRKLLERVAARAHEDDDASATVVLYYLAWLHLIAGEWERALERTDESRQIAADAAREGDVAAAVVTRAIVEAHLGRMEDARTHLDETRALTREAGGLPDAYAVLWAWGAALVASSAGRPEAAVEHLAPQMTRLRERGVEEPGYHPWFPTYADALVTVGKLDEAEELIDWLEERAVRLERRWALAMCAHMHGAIRAARGDADSALELFERALELHERVGRPFDRAWTLFAYGETLRRARRKARAREQLETALALFERLGAAAWVEKAHAELARISGRRRREGLTETELRVAELVAAGMSTKQAAAALVVSPKTIEGHLSNIYDKLGVHSRTQLAVRLADDTRG